MPANKRDPESSLIVEVVGTVAGLAIVGVIAYAMLYIRGRATPLYVTVMIGVLVCFGIWMLGGKVIRAWRDR